VDFFLLFWAANGAMKEREREEPGVSLKRPPLAQPMQQPTKKTVSTKGWVFFTRFGRGRTWGGQLTDVLDGNLGHEK
jgi:hypothetical protein